MEKKILFIGMTKNLGGLETFMMNVFRKLKGQGYKFEFIKDFSDAKLAYEDEIIQNGGMIRNVPVLDKKNRRPFIKYIIRRIMVKKFFEKHHDYDVVHINVLNINGIIFWVKEARKYGMKVVVHVHLDKLDKVVTEHNSKILFFNKIKLKLTEILTRMNLAYINKNKDIVKLSASENAGKYFFKHNFEVIDNGIDVKRFKFSENKRRMIRNELHLSRSTKIIMTVARISRQKNFPKIINIFNCMKKINSNIKLLIVGDGEEFKKINSMVNSNGLKNEVYFLGVRNDVNTLLSAADLILMPSILEAFPFALIESQTAGVPGLVSKDVIPVEENVTGELTYFSLERNNRSWAEIALKILNDHMDIHKKIHMYDEVSQSRYNLDNSIRKIEKIYNS